VPGVTMPVRFSSPCLPLSGSLDDEGLKTLEDRLGKAVLQSLEKEEEEIANENAARHEMPGFVDILWDRIDSIRHILAGVRESTFFFFFFSFFSLLS
jgi:hypothetical protein